MNNKNTIFLTGATGFIGSYLLKIFLENGHKVYVLAKNKNGRSAKERVWESVNFWDKTLLSSSLEKDDIPNVPSPIISKGEGNKNLIIIEGDITYLNLGIKPEKLLKELFANIEIIYHSAAITNIALPFDVINKTNVEGTKNVLNFALQCKGKGKLKKVNHISTAFVAGNIGRIDFTEDMLELGQEFHNAYEQTKYQAEILVKEYRNNGLNIATFRPTLVMGNSKEGKTIDFRLFFHALRFFSHGVFEIFPVNPKCLQNMINIDTTAEAIYLLGESPKNGTFHIYCPEDINLCKFIELASNFFKFKMPKLIPLDDFPFDKWTPVQKNLASPFIPYFNYKTRFVSKYTRNLLKNKGFVYPGIDDKKLEKIFSYCKNQGFIKK